MWIHRVRGICWVRAYRRLTLLICCATSEFTSRLLTVGTPYRIAIHLWKVNYETKLCKCMVEQKWRNSKNWNIAKSYTWYDEGSYHWPNSEETANIKKNRQMRWRYKCWNTFIFFLTFLKHLIGCRFIRDLKRQQYAR